MLKIQTYIKIVLASAILLLFIFSCKKNEDENQEPSYEYNIDGWFIDSITKNPVPNYQIQFWDWVWDGEATYALPLSSCKSDTTGYFHAIFSTTDSEVNIDDLSWRNTIYYPCGLFKVKCGTIHFDTICLIQRQTVGGVRN